MRERSKETYEIYRKYKNGASIKQLAEEYGITYVSARSRIMSAKFDEETEKELSEFQKLFPLNIARTLLRNGFNSEEDIYKAIESKKEVYGIGEKTLGEITDVIGAELVLVYSDKEHTHRRIEYQNQLKPFNIMGMFSGTVDGKPVSGVIEGKYTRLLRE